MTTMALQVSRLLENLEEEDYKMAISYIEFLAEERKKKYYGDGKPGTTKTQVNQLMETLTGILPDSGKAMEEYRTERLGKYENAD
jgi:hypothetical protein